MKLKTQDIKNKDDFLLFMNAFLKDLKNDSSSWENKSLDTFLHAMESWIDDMDGYYENLGLLEEVKLKDINWRVFADILMAARIYE
jgi:hypothetical protein